MKSKQGMHTIPVSVIMSTYNEELSWLKEAVESILNQSHQNIEFIIVVDNPQRKDIVALLEKYAQKNRQIILHVNKQNEGLVTSLNTALTLATSPYIARMDADDISHPERLEKQLAYIVNEKLDLIGCNVNIFNEQGLVQTTNKLQRHHYIKKMLARGAINIVHPTFFGKKEVFDILEGYRNSAYTEDMEFLARVICHKFKVGNVKDVLLDYRSNSISITKSNAFLVHKISQYISQSFCNCQKNNMYVYDIDYSQNMHISSEEITNFNHMKSNMVKAQQALYAKNYFRFLYYFIIAYRYSFAAISILKINIILKIYKFKEDREFASGKMLVNI